MRNNAYSIFWFFIAAALFSLLVYLAVSGPGKENAAKPVQTNIKGEVKGRPFDPNNPPDFDIENAEIVLSREDGTPKLKLKAEKMGGIKGVIKVHELSAAFRLEEKDELKITATDCTYFVEGHEAVVEGSVKGEILSRGQSFSAKKLSWNEDVAVIVAHDVVLADPQFESSGGKMEIDLVTGKISISSGVVLDL